MSEEHLLEFDLDGRGDIPEGVVEDHDETAALAAAQGEEDGILTVEATALPILQRPHYYAQFQTLVGRLQTPRRWRRTCTVALNTRLSERGLGELASSPGSGEQGPRHAAAIQHQRQRRTERHRELQAIPKTQQ